MHPRPPTKRSSDAAKPTPRKREDRLMREAAALRANLQKRKQQAREREAPANPDRPDTDQR